MIRKSIRLKNYDYKSNGYYFVTICTTLNKPLLVGNVKNVVERVLLETVRKVVGVRIDYYIIMPTHIHLILVFEGASCFLGEFVRRFKAVATKEVKIKPLWEWNYYEHIIRNQFALDKIREYICYNAEKHCLDIRKVYDGKEKD